MKYSTPIIAAASLAYQAYAFPHMARMAGGKATLEARAGKSISGSAVPDPAQVAGLFDPKLQYVSNTGTHKYVPPGPGDQRGPCPGLNAMANHGYLPHNGVATIDQFIKGTYEVFGMGLDLGAFLAVYGAVQDGNLLGWSIGGSPTGTLIGGAGITNSHNKYESDVSPTRGDLYERKDNWRVQMDQWKGLFDKQSDKSNAESNYNLQILKDYRAERFQQSIDNNPYFFNGPFSGVLVQPAAYTFIYRFMGNKSAEHPEGQLTKEVLMSFFGITENDDGSFSGGAGYERIPDNWYKRLPGNDYTIPFFNLDLVEEALAYPEFLNVGGNTGKTNTFAGVDVKNLTGGVYNLETLTEGNNLFCFGYQLAQGVLTDQAKGLGGTLTSLIAKLSPEAGKAIAALGCPQLEDIDLDLLKEYPGWTKSE